MRRFLFSRFLDHVAITNSGDRIRPKPAGLRSRILPQTDVHEKQRPCFTVLPYPIKYLNEYIEMTEER